MDNKMKEFLHPTKQRPLLDGILPEGYEVGRGLFGDDKDTSWETVIFHKEGDTSHSIKIAADLNFREGWISVFDEKIYRLLKIFGEEQGYSMILKDFLDKRRESSKKVTSWEEASYWAMMVKVAIERRALLEAQTDVDRLKERLEWVAKEEKDKIKDQGAEAKEEKISPGVSNE